MSRLCGMFKDKGLQHGSHSDGDRDNRNAPESMFKPIQDGLNMPRTCNPVLLDEYFPCFVNVEDLCVFLGIGEDV